MPPRLRLAALALLLAAIAGPHAALAARLEPAAGDVGAAAPGPSSAGTSAALGAVALLSLMLLAALVALVGIKAEQQKQKQQPRKGGGRGKKGGAATNGAATNVDGLTTPLLAAEVCFMLRHWAGRAACMEEAGRQRDRPALMMLPALLHPRAGCRRGATARGPATGRPRSRLLRPPPTRLLWWWSRPPARRPPPLLLLLLQAPLMQSSPSVRACVLCRIGPVASSRSGLARLI